MPLLLFSGLALAASAAQDEPMSVLRHKITRGLAILNDPQYRSNPAGRALQGERIWALSRDTFDFTVMSRLVLASRWGAFTPQQQAAFVREFAAFLRRAYLPELLERYNGEQIEFVRQVMVSPTRARVDVLVHWQERQIPVSAKMILRNGNWKIYDVSSLGISAVLNYRAQFQWMLRNESPAQVIEILKNSHGRMVDG
jgi:phospholipid transport system substrate-binding protein